MEAFHQLMEVSGAANWPVIGEGAPIDAPSAHRVANPHRRRQDRRNTGGMTTASSSFSDE
jgi:hypothetical protein